MKGYLMKRAKFLTAAVALVGAAAATVLAAGRGNAGSAKCCQKDDGKCVCEARGDVMDEPCCNTPDMPCCKK